MTSGETWSRAGGATAETAGTAVDVFEEKNRLQGMGLVRDPMPRMHELVPAGAQTTYRTLTNLLFALLSRPDQLDAVRADRSLIPRAIEEGLRWEPPLVSFTRVATRDTEIGGCPVSAGTKLNLCIHSANHDPSRWEDPDEFDLFRPMQPHLSFGQGPHICLGIHFARMELRVALEEILDSLPGLRLDPDADDVHIDGLMSRTALRLPCLWDPPGTGP